MATWDEFATTTTVSTDAAWQTWSSITSATTTTVTITSDIVWSAWTDNPDYAIRVEGRFDAPQDTDEVRRSREQANRAMTARRDKIKRMERWARARAAKLLKGILTPAQWKEWRKYRSVRIRGKEAIYEVGLGFPGNVIEIGLDGTPKRELCLQVGGDWGYCPEDKMAALILAMRTSEQTMRKIAGVNRSSLGHNERKEIMDRVVHLRAA